MGGVEQSDCCYSRPTDTRVLAIGALYVEEKKSVIPYKAEHAASKREEEKKPIVPPLRGEKQRMELSVPAAAGSPPHRGVSQSTPRFTEPCNKAKSQHWVAPREGKHQPQSKYWLGQIPKSPKEHKNLRTP